MSETGNRLTRLLVGIDNSPHSLAALQAALELAAEHGASVEGIFVEDVNLVRMAQLPFATEVVHVSARVRSLGLKDVERNLRAQADEARGALAQAATDRGVRWSFRVVRGNIAKELMAGAAEADLIVLGRSGWSGRHQAGSTARAVLRRASLPAMLLGRRAALTRPIMVAYDGSDAAETALATAAGLAASRDRGLSVLVLADDAKQAESRQAQAAAWLAEHELSARFRQLTGGDWQRQLRALDQIDRCLLVLPVQLHGVEPDEMVQLIDRLHCPVMVVR